MNSLDGPEIVGVMDIKCAIVRGIDDFMWYFFKVRQILLGEMAERSKAVDSSASLLTFVGFYWGNPRGFESHSRQYLSFFPFVSKYTRNKVRFYSVTLYPNLQNKMGSEKILRFSELVIHDTLYISHSMHSSILFPQHRSKLSLLPHVQDSE